MKDKETKIKDLEKQVCELESSVDSLAQYSRRNSLHILGVPEKEHESPVEVALELINKQWLDHSALDRVNRVGRIKDGTSRQLLVKFATYRERHRVYRAKKTLKSNNSNRIFVNEDLTRRRSSLLYKARQLKKTKHIMDCWSYDGQILIKVSHGEVIPINSPLELDRLSISPLIIELKRTSNASNVHGDLLTLNLI